MFLYLFYLKGVCLNNDKGTNTAQTPKPQTRRSKAILINDKLKLIFQSIKLSCKIFEQNPNIRKTVQNLENYYMQRSKFTTLEQTEETTQLSINYMIIIYK